MKISVELDDQSDDDAAALCAWLYMVLRDNGHIVSVGEITWAHE